MGNRVAVLTLWLASLFMASAQADIRVTDDLGSELVLVEPARRVVSLAPHITEALFAVGAGELVVGAVDYSNYPEAAKSIPRVGSHNKISYETIVSLKPDLVLAWDSGNGDEIVGRLRALGMTVYVDSPKVMDDVAKMLTHFGELTGHSEGGKQATREFTTELETLRRENANKPPVRVFYQVWHQPLMTLNGETLISDVISLCSGINVFADAIPKVPRLNIETVISSDPQVIVASGMGEDRPEWLDMWLDWPSMGAVQKQQLYFIEPDILQRHSPRIIEGAKQMCQHLDSARAALLKDKQSFRATVKQ